MPGDDTIGAHGLDKLPSPPRYRVFILGSDNRVLRMEPIAVETDDEALSQARAFVDGHAVELWDGLRFIEHFEPVDG